MRKVFHLTETGVKELQAELARLLLQRGPIVERLKSAREFGDLSENAEYTSARQEQELVEGRITKIQTILHNVKIIQPPQGTAKVRLGSVVVLQSGGKTKRFQVVGTVEADPLKGKISDESPIGQMLLGKRKDDELKIAILGEPVVYVIVDIV